MIFLKIFIHTFDPPSIYRLFLQLNDKINIDFSDNLVLNDDLLCNDWISDNFNIRDKYIIFSRLLYYKNNKIIYFIFFI